MEQNVMIKQCIESVQPAINYSQNWYNMISNVIVVKDISVICNVRLKIKIE